MFPSYFVLSATLAQSREISLDGRLFVGAIVTMLVFCGIPCGDRARQSRAHRRAVSASRGRRLTSLLAAAMLGLVLWPAAHELFLLNEWIGITLAAARSVGGSQSVSGAIAAHLAGVDFAGAGGRAGRVRGVFLPRRALCLAADGDDALADDCGDGGAVWAVPRRGGDRARSRAILCRARSWVWCSAGSAIGRGASGRACCCTRSTTGSILCVVHWRDELAARGFGFEEAAHLPATWLMLGGIGVVMAVALMIFVTRPVERELSSPVASD